MPVPSLVRGAVLALALLTGRPRVARGAALNAMTTVSSSGGVLNTTITVDEYTLTLTTPAAVTFRVREMALIFLYTGRACVHFTHTPTRRIASNAELGDSFNEEGVGVRVKSPTTDGRSAPLRFSRPDRRADTSPMGPPRLTRRTSWLWAPPSDSKLATSWL